MSRVWKYKNLKRCTNMLLVLAVLCSSGMSGLRAEERGPLLRGTATTNIKLEGESSFSKANQIINVSLRDTDVKQAMRMFADKAGLNIVFHESVQGKITMDLVNVKLSDALKMITQMAELTYAIDKDTILVMSNDTSKKLGVTKQNLNIIPLKYIDAGTIAKFLNTNIFTTNKPGLSNANIVTTNPKQNELLIFGTESDMQLAQKVISRLDVRPQISTYKVNHTTPKEMAGMICESLFSQKAGGGDMSSGWEDKIALGGSFQACVVKDATNGGGGDLAPLAGNALAVSYLPTLGNVQVIGGSVEQIQLISDFIAHNDKKQPQAYLEVSIVELNEDGSKEFSSTWNVYSHFFTGSLGGNGLRTADDIGYPLFWKGGNNLGDYSSIGYPNFFRGLVIQDPVTSSQAITAKAKYNQELSAWNVARSDALAAGQAFSTAMPLFDPPAVDVLNQAFKFAQPMAITQNINFLITNKKGRTLSNPKIMVTNGKKSTIDLSSDYVQSVKSQALQSTYLVGGGVQREYNIANDNGLKIEIVPFISPDGYVSLNIKPDYATIKQQVMAPNLTGQVELQATLLQRRNMELSNIRVKDGETLVLAGMLQEFETTDVSKTPILGDLPVIGPLFRTSRKGTGKAELVIMITPRIVKDSEDVQGNNVTL